MEAPPLERRLAAILAADVEGYSRLMHGDEDVTMTTLSARRALVEWRRSGTRAGGAKCTWRPLSLRRLDFPNRSGRTC
jgi:class 3 adenylate cyclase